MTWLHERLTGDVEGYWDDWQEWATRAVGKIADGIGGALTGDNALVSAFCSGEGVDVVICCPDPKRQVMFTAEFKGGGGVTVDRRDGDLSHIKYKRAFDPIDWIREDIAWVLGGKA